MSSRVGRVLGLLVVLAVAAGSGFWAGRKVLVAPEDPLADDDGVVTYTVIEGEVGRSLRFAAVAEWDLTPVASNGAAGTVTTVEFSSGDVAGAGDVLYSVDLRPVVVAQGGVPAFRDLSLNAQGSDVAQLQAFLAGLGHFTGEVDGVFRAGTRSAVQEWQRDLEVPVDGVVRRGDVGFVAELPARLALAETLRVGAVLAGGEGLVLAVPDEPRIWVPLSVEQRNLVPLSATVLVRYPGGVWEARVERVVEDSLRQIDLVLTAADGGAVCGDECPRWVALSGRTDFGADIIVLSHVSGPVVPVAAIRTDAANQTYVTAVSGEIIGIDIVASAQGIAVVEGVEVGMVLVLPTRPPGG